ncbi:glycoside hydrolase family 43 protein [Aspergillus stella-maris]|uniref:glycoside hydrolase family 43 protein n=1 Tax=Aspergillus stella-maris TaxID=1810926 RepID=UPI003CCDE10B
MRSVLRLTVLFALGAISSTLASKERTYTNPILPGWHSDPSCAYVPESSTFFCVTSTFIAFPGLPLYASKDLTNWELASNILNRPSQLPDLAETTNQQGGIYAPTLRYKDGKFYLIVSNLGQQIKGLVFTSTDPYDDAAWSDPLVFPVYGIDPDIFFEDDGTIYVSSADSNMIHHYSLDLKTGSIGPVTYLWNGTGGAYPEGPHIYKKDGFYYLLLAEGGTETNHSVTMARSRNRTGPWEPAPNNPILTNRGTAEYFQTVGHADLFQDDKENWFAVALSTRSGPEWVNYPMGRETVLTSGIWEEGGWPALRPVRGVMSGPLPAESEVENPTNEPEHLTFSPGSQIPKHLVYWRLPDETSYIVSPRGHPNTLRLTASDFGPSYSNSSDTTPVTFIARRQTDTLFRFSVDLNLPSASESVEAGISLFLTQEQHVDLSVVDVPRRGRIIQLKTTGRGNYDGSLLNVTIRAPSEWQNGTVSLAVEAIDDETYAFSAFLAGDEGSSIDLGTINARVLSGDTGRFTGTLVGVYASQAGRRNAKGKGFAYFSNWFYEGLGQKVDYDLIVPSY